MTDNEFGNVTDADVERQIRIMNQGYSGFYGGYDQGFRFERWASCARTTPSGSTSGQTLQASAT